MNWQPCPSHKRCHLPHFLHCNTDALRTFQDRNQLIIKEVGGARALWVMYLKKASQNQSCWKTSSLIIWAWISGKNWHETIQKRKLHLFNSALICVGRYLPFIFSFVWLHLSWHVHVKSFSKSSFIFSNKLSDHITYSTEVMTQWCLSKVQFHDIG